MKFSSQIVSALLPLMAFATPPVRRSSPSFPWAGRMSRAVPLATVHAAGRTFVPAGPVGEILVRPTQTGGQFSVLTLASTAGAGPGPAISHTDVAEAWYVLEGTFTFHVGDKIIEGGPGTLWRWTPDNRTAMWPKPMASCWSFFRREFRVP